MTRETSRSVSPQKPSVGQPPIMPDKLAKWAYRLACTGPFSLFVIASAYPPTDHHALPALPIQILWWALAVVSPLGVVLGGVAHYCILRSPVRMGGKNYASAAMMVGVLVTICLPSSTSMLNAQRKDYHYGNLSCNSNLKQLGISMSMYVQDYDDHYPLSASWNAATLPYTKNYQVYRCPREDVQKLPSYAMNRHLSGEKTGSVNDTTQTLLLFDSIPGEDRAGGRELLPTPDRHDGYQTIGFVDGHVKKIPVAEVGTVFWTLQTGMQTEQQRGTHSAH